MIQSRRSPGVAQATLRHDLGTQQRSAGGPDGANDLRRDRAAGPSRRPPARRRPRARTQRLSPCSRCAASPSSSALVRRRAATRRPARTHAERFAAAWERGDYAAMYAELTADDRDRVPRARFAAAYQDALRDRDGARRSTGQPRKDGERLPRAGPHPARACSAPSRGEVVAARPTRRRHRLVARARLPRARAPASACARETRMPDARRRCSPATARRWPRATTAPRRSLLGAAGRRRSWARSRPSAARSSPRSACPADAEVGVIGPRADLRRAPARHARRRAARRRPRARRSARRARRAAVRTTIVAAGRAGGGRPRSAGRLGGVVAIEPAHRRGARLRRASPSRACSRRARRSRSSPRRARWRTGIAKPADDLPGRRPRRCSRASTSRTPTASPAAARSSSPSRNRATRSSPRSARSSAPSASSPTAERFGFNAPPGIPGAAESTIPAADEIGDDLAVGSSAIGQGRVQATALQMATSPRRSACAGAGRDLTLDLDAAHGRAAATERATSAARRAHDGAADARRRARRHRRRARRSPASRSPARPARPSCARPRRASPTPRIPRAARPRTRPTTRPTPTPGSSPTPRRARAARAGRGRRAARRRRAPAATPRRPRRARCCSAALKAQRADRSPRGRRRCEPAARRRR